MVGGDYKQRGDRVAGKSPDTNGRGARGAATGPGAGSGRTEEQAGGRRTPTIKPTTSSNSTSFVASKAMHSSRVLHPGVEVSGNGDLLLRGPHGLAAPVGCPCTVQTACMAWMEEMGAASMPIELAWMHAIGRAACSHALDFGTSGGYPKNWTMYAHGGSGILLSVGLHALPALSDVMELEVWALRVW